MEKIQTLYNSWLAFFGPNPYLKALGIVLIFTAFVLIFNFVILRLLKKVTAKTAFKADDRLLELLQKPLFVSLFVVGLTQAVRVLQLPDNVLLIVVSILKTVTIFVWASFAIKFSKFLLNQLSADKRKSQLVQKSTLPLFSNLTVIIIIAAAVYFLFLAWRIDVSAWLASAGIIGLALGFAAKDTLANLFAGVFILADAPYRLGDVIVLDTGERGQVTHIGIRSTRLLTNDDVEITVPNSVMGNAKITNEAGGPSTKHRIRMKVGVAYGSDIDQVREVLEQVAADNSQICKIPEPRVRFRNFGNSSLDFELLCWVDMPVLRGQVLDKLYTNVYKKFMELEIEIPYSKQDVYIKSMPST
ncbi:MAG: mechanosensitive ion channel family protein [Gammaproteobacteria bacterium]|nr:mechanosensitive ion channel family protein [Gammaproteobacteria bacterium]